MHIFIIVFFMSGYRFELINFRLFFFGPETFWNKENKYTQSIYTKINLYCSKNFLSIWMIMQTYFIAFRIIQIHNKI